MSNRCPNCNKFVSLEQQEPELDLAVDGDEVSGTVRLVLACAECSEEMKELHFDVNIKIKHACDDDTIECEFEISDESAEATDRYNDKDRKGKPIKNMRYMAHYYGADISVTVKCAECGEEIELSDTVEEAASGFESLV